MEIQNIIMSLSMLTWFFGGWLGAKTMFNMDAETNLNNLKDNRFSIFLLMILLLLQVLFFMVLILICFVCCVFMFRLVVLDFLSLGFPEMAYGQVVGFICSQDHLKFIALVSALYMVFAFLGVNIMFAKVPKGSDMERIMHVKQFINMLLDAYMAMVLICFVYFVRKTSLRGT